MEILENKVLIITATFFVYTMSRRLQRRTGIVFLNPILITMFSLIAFLKITGISYETYYDAGQYLDFWLKPAIVALGLPLYKQLSALKKQILPILASQFAGCIVGILSAVWVAQLCGASQEVIISLAPKSVTTPIAMEVVEPLGGIPSLTAAVVICVGLLGALIGTKTLEIFGVKSSIAIGLSLGTASHAIGTTRANEFGPTYGAYASVGLIANGIVTAIVTPYILQLIGII